MVDAKCMDRAKLVEGDRSDDFDGAHGDADRNSALQLVPDKGRLRLRLVSPVGQLCWRTLQRSSLLCD